MKTKNLTALLFAGALGCTGEVIQPPAAEPSCHQGRVWYQDRCVDPEDIAAEASPEPESCRMQAERVCLGRFVYWADGCGILADRPVSSCTYRENCRGEYREPDEFLAPACEPGETIFYEDFDSLEGWFDRAYSHVEEGVLEMGWGVIEPSAGTFDRTLMQGGDSLVFSITATLGNRGLNFSELCTIYDDGVIRCLGESVQTSIDPRARHTYVIRMENLGHGDIGLYLQIDHQEDVLMVGGGLTNVFKLGWIRCFDTQDNPYEHGRCSLYEMSIERVEPWQPVDE